MSFSNSRKLSASHRNDSSSPFVSKPISITSFIESSNHKSRNFERCHIVIGAIFPAIRNNENKSFSSFPGFFVILAASFTENSFTNCD